MSEAPRTGLFITATGTDAGKTVVTRGIAAALTARGRSVAAIKPLETGCTPHAADADALARACGRPELAHAPGLYRVSPPLAPYAATLAGCAPPPTPEDLARAVVAASGDAGVLLVEGAGGLRVPLDASRDMTDLAAALGLSIALVAPDGLGVLSHVLTAVDCARTCRLRISCVILRSTNVSSDDPSPASNAAILRQRLDCPVLHFPWAPAADDATLGALLDDDWLRTVGI